MSDLIAGRCLCRRHLHNHMIFEFLVSTVDLFPAWVGDPVNLLMTWRTGLRGNPCASNDYYPELDQPDPLRFNCLGRCYSISASFCSSPLSCCSILFQKLLKNRQARFNSYFQWPTINQHNRFINSKCFPSSRSWMI